MLFISELSGCNVDKMKTANVCSNSSSEIVFERNERDVNLIIIVLDCTLLRFISDTTGKQTDVLIMDFSKAFGKVSHTCNLLVHKLEHNVIRGKVYT